MRTAILCLALLAAGPLFAQHDHHQHHAAPKPPAHESVRPVEFPDVVLTAQDGRKVHFYTDLVKDRVVAVNFIFTSCTTVCPVMGTRFGRVQTLLADGGKDVSLISISIDPTNDTPQALAGWSKRFNAKPGWTLVTGSKLEVEKLLKALGVTSADPASHTPVVIVGDDRRGSWDRVDGLAEPSKLAKMLDELVKERTR